MFGSFENAVAYPHPNRGLVQCCVSGVSGTVASRIIAACSSEIHANPPTKKYRNISSTTSMLSLQNELLLLVYAMLPTSWRSQPVKQNLQCRNPNSNLMPLSESHMHSRLLNHPQLKSIRYRSMRDQLHGAARMIPVLPTLIHSSICRRAKGFLCSFRVNRSSPLAYLQRKVHCK